MAFTVTILKVYKYRGARVHIRLLNSDVYEYIVSWRNKVWSDHFVADKKILKTMKEKGVGGATLLVCQSAEGLVDALIARHTLLGRLWTRFTFTKPVEESTVK